jgi:alpha-L-fucosidase 2
MLLQSHGKDEVIRLLPALPAHKDWQQGSIKGLKARNGFEIDMQWKDGKLLSAAIQSKTGGVCILQYKDRKMNVTIKPGVKKELKFN